MTNKAYIVANEQQVDEIEKLLDISLTKMLVFPYVAYVDDVNGSLMYGGVGSIKNEEIVYDGRKEEHMSEKYVVSQEFMNKLEEWRKNNNLINNFVGYVDLGNVPAVVAEWWKADMVNTLQTNNRLIAIIRWVNGEDVFEVEKPKKWVVRSKEPDEIGSYWYVLLHVGTVDGRTFDSKDATKFDTKEEAESWANAHQEVVEVVDI